MLLTLAAALASLGLLSAGPLRARREQRLAELWRRVGVGAGLDVLQSRPDGVVATLGGLKVTISAPVARDLRRLVIPGDASVTFSWPDAPDVAIVARRSWQAGAAPNATGEEAFDQRFDVQGSAATVRALLDHGTRRGLRALLAVLRRELRTLGTEEARHLAMSGRGLAGLADVMARLAENTRREPVASVRAANIRWLASAFPDSQVTTELARSLLTDRNPWVRLDAAMALPAEGRPVLLALAECQGTTEACALRALQELRATLSRAEIRSGLARTCDASCWKTAASWMALFGGASDSDDTRAAAAVLAGWLARRAADAVEIDEAVESLDAEIARHSRWWNRIHDESPLAESTASKEEFLAACGVSVAVALARALRRAPRGNGREEALVAALEGPQRVRVAAAEGLVCDPEYLPVLWDRPELPLALGALGPADGPSAEQVLLAALAHPSLEVVRASVPPLGRVGTVRAIPPLLECGERYEADPEVRRAVRQTVAEIQSRLPGASPGQLSIAGTEAGQVSLVEEDQRGRVSLEADEEARPS